MNYPQRAPRSGKRLLTRRCSCSLAMPRRWQCIAGAAARNGIWDGLWCLPEFDTVSAASSFTLRKDASKRAQNQAADPCPLWSTPLRHFDLVSRRC